MLVLPSIQPAKAETLGSWTATTPWGGSSGITDESCAISSGYIYCVGGFLAYAAQSEVYYAAVSSGGVGTWKSTTTYPSGFDDGSCAITGGYIYCVGGLTGSDETAFLTTNAVYYAPVSSSGVGTWTSTTSFPFAVDGQSCAIGLGNIYCVGGYFGNNADNIPGNGVYSAPVSSSGVGQWAGSTFPLVIQNQSCAISGDYIYCIGGNTVVIQSTGQSEYTHVVGYAPISTSGIGTFTLTTSYPTDIFDTSCGASSGYIYCVGGLIGTGLDDGESATAAVYYAQATTSGIGTWSSTSSYSEAISGQSCPISGGYIYCVGGQNSGFIILPDVNYVSISASPAPTSTTVSCSPVTVAAGTNSTCTATVSGSSPTGTVTWSSTSSTPSFSSPTCTLSSGSCAVTYSDTTSGAPLITASYGGDSQNDASSGSFILANFSPAATSADSTPGEISGGNASADQTSTTGVAVSVSGSSASDGTQVTIFSADLPAQPSGTSTLSLTGIGFYDVRISGITDGTAMICISSAAVISSTELQYYSGGSWTSASDVKATPGVEICGDVPVSALTGTPIVTGNPATTTSSTTSSMSSSTTSSTSSSSSTSFTTTSSTTSSTTTSTSSHPLGVPEFPAFYSAVLVAAVGMLAYSLMRRKSMLKANKVD
jgi:hypothetical protein